MRSFWFLHISLIIFLLSPFSSYFTVSSASVENIPSLVLTYNNKGIMSASLKFDNPNQDQDIPQLIVLGYPFEVDLETTYNLPKDSSISILSKGNGYSVFVLWVPPETQTISLEIINFNRLREASEGRSKFQIDVSYQFANTNDKRILSLPSTISLWAFQIKFPKAYDKSVVSINPPIIFEWIDDSTISFSMVSANENNAKSIEIAVPNPASEENKQGLIFVGLLVGILLLLFEGYRYRNRNIRWLIGTNLVSFF
ncbi:MAG: hypothetical protein AB9891_04535 [Anaerolineaceae bacterium]